LARVPVISPLFAVALLAFAAIAATRLHWVRRPEPASPRPPILAPLGWYAVGIVLGPVLGLLDHRLLEAGAPALMLAAGWVAARAGSATAAPPETRPSAAIRAGVFTDAVAAWVVPAALLYAAARFLATPLAPAWEPRLPIVAVLAAGLAVMSGARRPVTTLVALCALVGAVLVSLPPGNVLGVPRPAVWIGIAVAGILGTGIVWQWIARRTTVPLSGAVAALPIGAGVGLATGASPVVVCALAGAVATRRSQPPARLGIDLARSEAPAAAMLWVAAGAQAGGPLAAVAIAAVALSLWPMARRLAARTAAPGDPTMGLALVLSYVWTTGRDSPEPLVTAVAIAVLLAGSVSARGRGDPSRLTSGLAPAEVSV
jgi:hypothetical protein